MDELTRKAERERLGMIEITQALIKHRRELAEIEFKLYDFINKGEATDRRMDRLERRMTGLLINPRTPLNSRIEAILKAGRRVVKSRDDAGSWDELKNAIAELADALEAMDDRIGGE